MEEALQESEEKYRKILENIAEEYYEVDLAGNFTFSNDSVCRMMGYPREELMGMNNSQYMDQENAKSRPLALPLFQGDREGGHSKFVFGIHLELGVWKLDLAPRLFLRQS